MLTIYGTPSCGSCVATKVAARRAGIPFEFVDLTDDRETTELLRGANGARLTLPVVITETGQRWEGYRRDLIRASA